MFLLLLAVPPLPPVPSPIVRVSPPVVQASVQPVPIPFPVEVNVTADGRTVYRGTLRVAPGYRASVSEGLTQAPIVICPGGRSWDSSDRQMLNVELSQTERTDGDRLSVSVTWLRPNASTQCGPGGGRTVALSDSATLKPGSTATFTGDGGLKVTLTRR